MESLLDDVVHTEDLKKFEKQFNEQLERGFVNPKTKLEYAWCLVRSKYAVDIKKGVYLLEDLLKNGEIDAKRDYLFFLAIGNAKLKEYSAALQYLRTLLSVEPSNQQAEELQRVIKKRMEKEGLMGIAIVSGAVLALGAVVGLGIALSKK